MNDVRAELLQARGDTDTSPTAGQKHAGNYRKGRFRWNGLEIAIEQPVGSVRSGRSKHGPWSTRFKFDYGYIANGPDGADGDKVDVYVNDRNLHAPRVFVINQVDQLTGRFDEHKAMVGFDSARAAVDAYLAHYERGWKVGPVATLSVPEFLAWLKSGDHAKPLAKAEGAIRSSPNTYLGVDGRGRAHWIANPQNFQSWFAGSRVTNPDGTPKVVYHATAATFQEFNTRPGDALDYDSIGAWFADTPDLANEVMNFNSARHDKAVATGRIEQWPERWRTREWAPQVAPVFLSIKNPLVVPSRQAFDSWMEVRGTPGEYYRQRLPSWDKARTTRIIKTRLIREGYDGIFIVDDNGFGPAWVAFSPRQIKSALGNTGEYNPRSYDFGKAAQLALFGDGSIKNAPGNFLGVDRRGRVHWRKQDRPKPQEVEVYHGTDTMFDRFDPSRGSEWGIYVTPNRDYAYKYGKHRRRALARIVNPKWVEWKGEISPRDLTHDDVIRLQRQGFDAIAVGNPERGLYGASEIVLFDADQVQFTDQLSKRVPRAHGTFREKLEDVVIAEHGFGAINPTIKRIAPGVYRVQSDALRWVDVMGALRAAGMEFRDAPGRFAVDVIEPGRPTDLDLPLGSPEQRRVRDDYRARGIRSQAFKAWFGDWENFPDDASKVVTPTTPDGYGEPKAMFHGTRADFDAFDAQLANPGLYGRGFYFTDNRAVAFGGTDSVVIDLVADSPEALEKLARGAFVHNVRQIDEPRPEVTPTHKRNTPAGWGSAGDLLWQKEEEALALWQLRQGKWTGSIRRAVRTGGGYAKDWPDNVGMPWHMAKRIKAAVEEATAPAWTVATEKERADLAKALGELTPEGWRGTAGQGEGMLSDLPMSSMQKLSAIARRAPWHLDVFEIALGLGYEPQTHRTVYLNIRNPFVVDTLEKGEHVAKTYWPRGTADTIDGLSQVIMPALVAYLRRWAGSIQAENVWSDHAKAILDLAADIKRDGKGRMARFAEPRDSGYITGEEVYRWLESIVGQDRVNDVLAEAGFDGIRHVGGIFSGGPRHDVWIALQPGQVKAVANRGTFDAGDADIYKASIGLEAQDAGAGVEAGMR